MYWFDGHLDLAYLALNGRDLTAANVESDMGCITLPRLRSAGVSDAFATIFTEPVDGNPSSPEKYRREDATDAEAAGLRQLTVYQQLHDAGEIVLKGRKDASLQGDAIRQIEVTLLMEGADPIQSPDYVDFWFDRGVRIVGLTWASGTRYAGGNASASGEGPLTTLGVELVKELDRVGIIHDVSHLSDAAFDDLLEQARPGRRNIIASHSNCRALLDPKQRHLRDEQIKTIGDRGGIVGLNLYSPFLAVGRRATIADCIAHVEHVVEIMGHRRGVALGSDMDGGFGPDALPIGLERPEHLIILAEALRDRGWSDEDTHGFASGNWSDLMRQFS